MFEVKLKGRAVALAVASALGGTANAVDFPIRSISVTGGSFEMAGITGAPFVSAIPFGLGTPPNPPTGTNAADLLANGGFSVGPFINSPAEDPAKIAGFYFFAAPLNSYTAALNFGGTNSPAGTLGCSAGPVSCTPVSGTADPTADSVTLNMESMWAQWNGTDFNQGHASAGKATAPAMLPMASGTFPNPYVGHVFNSSFDGTNYTAEWTSPIIGGPFDGKAGRWVFTGVAIVAPVASDDLGITTGTTPVTTAILDNDIDAPGAGGPINPASLTLIDDPGVTEVFGTCALGTGGDAGKIVYTSTLGADSADKCKYTVASIGGAVSDVATLSVGVGGVVAPTVVDDGPLAATEDTPFLIDVTPSTVMGTPPATGLLANDSDDGTFSLNTFIQPAVGVVVDNMDGTLTYTPPDDFNGTTTFTYDTIDNLGAQSVGSAVVTINVTAVNDDPIAPVIMGVYIPSDSVNNVIDVIALGPVTDIDNITGDLTVTAVGVVVPPTNGSVSIGSVLYTPTPGYEGPDTFSYTISDGAGGTATGTVTVNVAAAGAEFTIVSGTFTMPGVSPGGQISVFGPGSDGVIRNGFVTGFSGASPGADADPQSTDFDFFGFPVDTYTNITGVDTAALNISTPGGAPHAHSVPLIDLDAMTADLSSWYMFWNGIENNQGSRSVINNAPETTDATVTNNFDGTFTIAWDSRFIGGPFDAYLGVWTLTVQGPSATDSDNDGLPDSIEDSNGNGFVDAGETDPQIADSDQDGLLDGEEDRNINGIVDVGETDPLNPDTDSDGLLDGQEDRNNNGFVDSGETDPLDPDSDDDGALDGDEDINGNGIVDAGESDPFDYDTDNDGLSDGYEINVAGTDPSTPTILPESGDLNADGDVNLGDLLLLQRQLLSVE